MKPGQSIRLIACIGLLVLVGASPSPGQEAPPDPATPIIPGSREARERLDQERLYLENLLIERMRESSAEAERGFWNRGTRRRIDRWAGFVVARMSETLENPDSLVALLDLWALSVQMDDYVQHGKGSDDFGVEQVRVRRTMAAVRETVRDSVRANLAPEAFATAEANILTYAAANPLDYDASRLSRLFDLKDVPFSVVKAGENTLKSVASVPLLPQRAGESIREGTAGIRDFNETASRFTDVVEALPQRTREELEALLAELDDQASTLTLVTSDLREISGQVDSSLKTVESMSPDVRETVRSVDDAAQTLAQTAHEFEAAAGEVRRLVESLDPLMDQFTTGTAGSDAGAQGSGFSPEAYAETAGAIESGAAEVRRLISELDRLLHPVPTEPADGEDGGRPFDIREYTEAARAIEKGGVEVRGVLNDLTATSGNEALSKSSEDILNRAVEANDRISSRLELLAGRLLLRLGGFFLFLTVLVAAYKASKSRYFPEAPRGG